MNAKRDFKTAFEQGMEGFEILASSDDEGGFSWSPCDVCGQSLGGTRYDAIMCNPGKDTDKIEVRVCPDCIVYAANGDLPSEE